MSSVYRKNTCIICYIHDPFKNYIIYYTLYINLLIAKQLNYSIEYNDNDFNDMVFHYNILCLISFRLKVIHILINQFVTNK